MTLRSKERDKSNPVLAVLLGTAVGDSLGLPAENLPPWRIQKRWPGAWQQRFAFGRGMVSDDTEHTVFVAQSLARHPNDVRAFQRMLAWRLRWWLLCIPAGIGFATLRAILKLWIGFPPMQSGVFSAGNGPAMRSAIIGAFFAGNDERIREFVRASTRLTHTDPKAETAAVAVALTASWSATVGVSSSPQLRELEEIWLSANPADGDWRRLITQIVVSLGEGQTVTEFVKTLGLQKGVTGYAYHTVPVALYAWFRHFGDFRTGLEAVLNCGGDTDTVGAITGALLAINGKIPIEWSSRLFDFPISRNYLEQLACELTPDFLNSKANSPTFQWWALPFRNLIFLTIVFAHITRRLLP